MSSETGKLAYLREPGDLEMREYPIPEPDRGSVVTEVVRTNVCGSERHIWEGNAPITSGTMGHEAVCRVAALGEGVETDYAGNQIAEGDLIVPVYFGTCQRCPACQRVDFHRCQNAFSDSGDVSDPPHFRGTFATHYYVSPKQYFYKLPDGVDPSVGAMATCALSQVYFGIDRIDVTAEETVVVQGAGGLGLNALAIADQKGARTILVEGVDDRIETAREFGVDQVVDFREYDTVSARADRISDLTDGTGADVAIEVAGVPDAFTEGVQLLRNNGRYMVIGNGFPGRTTEFDPALITSKSLTVQGVARYQPWYLMKSLSFLQRHGDRYPYDQLFDTTFPLENASEALQQSADRNVTRASLVPNADS